MRILLGPLLLACSLCLCAQTDDPEVVRAKAGIEKLRALVEAGAAPRAQLTRAEEAIADAEDAARLRKSIYDADLTEEQADEMIAAGNRRIERRKKAYEQAQELVRAGVASQLSLGTFLDEMDLAKKELDVAESRARLVREMARMAQAEQALEDSREENLEPAPVIERRDGDGTFTRRTLNRIQAAFQEEFGKPLPVSANGATAVHRAMGFDHQGRVDVALQPDQPEGIWLRNYLNSHHIPYFAFRRAVAGKATGAHIHIGPMSTRLVAGG